MLVAARTPVQVGAILWPGDATTATLVVKRTFELVPRGEGGIAQDQDPLRLDTYEGDLLVHPTDFAPTKSACDVLVVGRAIGEPRGPVRVVVDPMRKLVERSAHLGPRAGVGALGDPTDPHLEAAWTRPTFDFEALQSAPRDQRIPFASLPLEVVVDYGESRFVTRLEGTAPEAVVLDQRGWAAPSLVALRADTIALDPDRRKVVIAWRGVLTVPPEVEPLIVVELAAPIRSLQPWEMLRWPRAEVIEPQVLRRLASLAGVAAQRRGPRGTAAIDAPEEEEVAESTLTLRVEPVAVVPAVEVAQGPLRPADLEAATMAPDQLVRAAVRAPTFGPPPPSREPSAPAPAPPARAHEPLAPTRISQTLSRPELQAAIAAHRAASAAAPRVDRDRLAALEAPPRELPPSTVAVEVPPELRASGLPFGSRPPPPPARAPVATMTDETGARSDALPFVRATPATRPLPDPPPPRSQRKTNPPMDGDAVEDPLASTLSGGVSPAAALPFRPAGGAPATRPPPVAPSPVLPFAAPSPGAPGPVSPAATPFTPPPVTSPALVAPAPVAPALVAPALVAPALVATPAVAAPPAAAAVPSAVLLGVAARLGAPSPAVVPPAVVPPAPPGRGEELEGLSPEQFAEIKVALWNDVEGRRDTLEKHGLSELRWRLVEKRFVADLARRRPDEVRAVRERLRQLARRASDA